MNTQASSLQGLKFTDLLKLDKFFAPKIILVLYWIAMVSVVFAAIGSVVSAGIFGLLVAPFVLLLGGLYVRLIFETMSVFFSINNHLREIRDNSKP